jgi:hypothetical protein
MLPGLPCTRGPAPRPTRAHQIELLRALAKSQRSHGYVHRRLGRRHRPPLSGERRWHGVSHAVLLQFALELETLPPTEPAIREWLADAELRRQVAVGLGQKAAAYWLDFAIRRVATCAELRGPEPIF